MNPKILISKLHKYGIRGTVIDLIDSFLECIHGSFSDRIQLLYNPNLSTRHSTGIKIRFTAIFYQCERHCKRTRLPGTKCIRGQYKCIFTSRRIDGLEGKVNRYLNSLSLWLRQNQLQLNASKTTYVIFYLINRIIERPLTVKFEECIISKVKQQNFQVYGFKMI